LPVRSWLRSCREPTYLGGAGGAEAATTSVALGHLRRASRGAFTRRTDFSEMVGQEQAIIHRFQDWVMGFDFAYMVAAVFRGGMPLVSWASRPAVISRPASEPCTRYERAYSPDCMHVEQHNVTFPVEITSLASGSRTRGRGPQGSRPGLRCRVSGLRGARPPVRPRIGGPYARNGRRASDPREAPSPAAPPPAASVPASWRARRLSPGIATGPGRGR
jgi:hypothetical protein